MWFPNRSDTNRPVQSQKRARILKFRILVEEELYYPSSENKGADQLHSYRLPSAPIFPIFSYIFRASYFFLYFDHKSYIFTSNSYIFQIAADNNETSRKNHGILV